MAPVASEAPSRAEPRVVLLSVAPGARLQAQIDALSEDTVGLVIHNAADRDDDARGLVLDRPLPALESLALLDVDMARVRLTPETAPRLRSLRLQNVPDACDLDIRLPALTDVSIHYWCGDEAPLQRMLDAASELQRFDSYKLVVQRLSLASNALRTVDLGRAELLEALSLWAPSLVSLRLDGCHALRTLQLLDAHPLQAELPPGHGPSRVEVSARNANLGPAAARVLREHPRVLRVDRPAPSAPPTAAFFAEMRGALGTDDEDEEEDGEESEEDDEEEEEEEEDYLAKACAGLFGAGDGLEEGSAEQLQLLHELMAAAGVDDDLLGSLEQLGAMGLGQEEEGEEAGDTSPASTDDEDVDEAAAAYARAAAMAAHLASAAPLPMRRSAVEEESRFSEVEEENEQPAHRGAAGGPTPAPFELPVGIAANSFHFV